MLRQRGCLTRVHGMVDPKMGLLTESEELVMLVLGGAGFGFVQEG